MKKACVFGGSGFLGSHVADKLSDSGYEVTIFDKDSSLWSKDYQRMIIGDILDQDRVDEAVSEADVVYNFAAIADLNAGIRDPIGTMKVNVLGNGTVLEACRKNKIKRFVYASSVYVYSRHGGFYRCSKQAAEHYVEEYASTYGLDYTILRYGSLYGPRSDGSNGVYRIIRHALETGTISYSGSEESLREYVHVEDAAQASVAILKQEFRNQHIVLTGQEQLRVEDMLKMLAEIIDCKQPVEFKSGENEAHYIRTPYSYQPKLGLKYIPPVHIDMGQGLIQLIEDIQAEITDTHLDRLA